MHEENLDNVSRLLLECCAIVSRKIKVYAVIYSNIFLIYILLFYLLFFYQLGYSEDKEVKGAKENDRAKEKAGFIAGKHIHKKGEWWFQQIGRQKKWVEESSDSKNEKEGGDKPAPS